MTEETTGEPWFLPKTDDPTVVQLRDTLHDLINRVTQSRDERGYRRHSVDDETYFQLGMLAGGLARLMGEHPELLDG